MALIAERKYSKDEILENYLNEIYLGQRGSQGIFGVSEAAKFYFSKPLSDLTVGEIALLAGLIRAPNRLSPYRSAEAATKRRNVVLAKLLDDQIITLKQYDAAIREKLPAASFGESHQRRAVLRRLSAARARRELFQRGADQRRACGFLAVSTCSCRKTPNARLSTDLKSWKRLTRRCGAKATTIVWKARSSSSARKPARSRRWWAAETIKSRSSIASFRPSASRVRYSSLLSILAALMFGGQSGVRYTPETVLNDCQFTWNYDGQEWQPDNYNNEYFGAVTFRRALESSLNSATGRVAQDVGIRRVRDLAQRLGIQSPLAGRAVAGLGRRRGDAAGSCGGVLDPRQRRRAHAAPGGQAGDGSKHPAFGKARRARRAGASIRSSPI